MDPVIHAEGVHKAYGETVALDGVDLTVEAGEVFGLIGPNGAGKTTLVRSLTGTTRPDSGSVRVLGTTPRAADPERIGLLPQSFVPPERLTPRELFRYYAGLYEASRAPESLLADVGLADAADTRYEHLSGGQQRRTCLGAAVVNDPDVLFLDEPTTGIDPAGRRTIRGLIADLAAGGTTVVLTTHDMIEAERLADRVGLLAGGRLVAIGSPAELIDEHGGPSAVTFELTGKRRDGLIEGARHDVEERGFSTSMRDGALVVDGVEPTDVGTVAGSLEEVGVEYTSLTWSEAGLEEVYLELAGDLETSARNSDRPAAIAGERP